MFDQALEFIWQYSHCQAVRLSIYHIKSKEEGTLKADQELKNILKIK
jgi:hypothetical protein